MKLEDDIPENEDNDQGYENDGEGEDEKRTRRGEPHRALPRMSESGRVSVRQQLVRLSNPLKTWVSQKEEERGDNGNAASLGIR